MPSDVVPPRLRRKLLERADDARDPIGPLLRNSIFNPQNALSILNLIDDGKPLSCGSAIFLKEPPEGCGDLDLR